MVSSYRQLSSVCEPSRLKVFLLLHILLLPLAYVFPLFLVHGLLIYFWLLDFFGLDNFVFSFFVCSPFFLPVPEFLGVMSACLFGGFSFFPFHPPIPFSCFDLFGVCTNGMVAWWVT